MYACLFSIHQFFDRIDFTLHCIFLTRKRSYSNFYFKHLALLHPVVQKRTLLTFPSYLSMWNIEVHQKNDRRLHKRKIDHRHFFFLLCYLSICIWHNSIKRRMPDFFLDMFSPPPPTHLFLFWEGGGGRPDSKQNGGGVMPLRPRFSRL